MAVLATIAVGVSGCGGSSSTLSDAATLTFRDTRGDQTVHISRDALLERVEQSTSNQLFRDLAKANDFDPGDGGETSGAKLTAFWLSQLINQAVIDAEFTTQHLQVTDADKTQALEHARASFARSQGDTKVFDAFPKEMRDQLVDARARLDVVLQSCGSGRLVEHILLKTEAQARDAYRADPQRRAVRSGREGQVDRLGFGAARWSARLCRPRSVRAGVPKGGRGSAVRHGDNPREDEVRLPPDPRSALGSGARAEQPTDRPGAATSRGASLDARLKDLHVKVDPRFGTWGLHDSGTQGQKTYNVSPPDTVTPRTSREQG